MHYLILSFSLICLVISVNCKVPVLIWESSTISDKDDSMPALHQLDPDEFLNHITKKVHQLKPLIVVFLEESLSVEDFSWRNDRGKGSFPQLHNITSMSAKNEFLTSVTSPMEALQEMGKTQGYEWKKYEGEVVGKPGQIVVVRMEDPFPEEDRPELLSRHDGTIATVYSQLLSRNSHVVAMLTGRSSSWSEPDSNRVRRQADGPGSTTQPSSPLSHSHMVAPLPDNLQILLSMPDFPELTMGGQNVSLGKLVDIGKNQKKKENGSEAELMAIYKLDNGNKMTLSYTFTNPKDSMRWSMDGIVIKNGEETEVLKPSDDKNPIGARLGTSYKTNKPIEFIGKDINLRFPDGFQAQAFMPADTYFASVDVNNDYLTTPIAMGLFTTFLLGLILTWALTMIMDIRTMDRFDDPKGKTIAVAQGD